MSLILYPANETAFDTNGIGILSDAVDDEVYEELNGQFELTVQYPVDGIHFADIVTEAYITAKPNPVSERQPFRIYRITKPMNGIVTIYARHYAYKNNKIVVSPFTAANAPAALQALKANAANECPFEFWTDKETEAEMKVIVPTAIWTLLGGSKGSVLDTYGGEYEFDRSTVKLWSRRGADRGVTIRYGKNLTDLKQDENVANVFTGVYPYWTDGSGALVQLPERYISGPGEYEEAKIMPLDLSQEFTAAPTMQQLRERTEKYIKDNDIGKPDISWTVEFVQLEQTEEYRGKALLERVLLGDTVSVFFPKLNVNATSRAVAARYKPTLERYKSITLGKVKANLASTIVQQQQQIEQIKKPTNLQEAVDRATGWITGGSGYMLAVRDENGTWQEICSLDTPDISQAVNIWRWNNGGFGFSSTGYNGPFRVAITQEGEIVADFITAGTLDAALVKVVNLVAESIVAGKLSSKDGNVCFDLDAGEIITEGAVVPGLPGLTGFRIANGLLVGTYREGVNGEKKNVLQIFSAETGAWLGTASGSGADLYLNSDKDLHIGCIGDLYLAGKKLAWLTKDGYSYLVGTDA